MPLKFGVGIDKAADLIEIAENYNIITRNTNSFNTFNTDSIFSNNLNNNNDMIYLIDSYISDFSRFKELIYNNDKLKINEKFIWKLILSKENIKDLEIINYSYYIYKSLFKIDYNPYNYPNYLSYIKKDLINPFLRILSMDITLNDLLITYNNYK